MDHAGIDPNLTCCHLEFVVYGESRSFSLTMGESFVYALRFAKMIA